MVRLSFLVYQYRDLRKLRKVITSVETMTYAEILYTLLYISPVILTEIRASHSLEMTGGKGSGRISTCNIT